MRCRSCSRRFYAAQSPAPLSDGKTLSSRSQKSSSRLRLRNKRRLARLMMALAVFAVAFIVFLIFLHYETRFKDPF